jgi:hypothetical protein
MSLKDSRIAVPSLSMASAIFSGDAAANVARKNICIGTKSLFSAIFSAANQLPGEMRTPLSTEARKSSSSMAARSLVLASGCFFQLISIHSCSSSEFEGSQYDGMILTNMPAAGGFQLTTSRGRYFSQAANIKSRRLVYSIRR